MAIEDDIIVVVQEQPTQVVVVEESTATVVVEAEVTSVVVVNEGSPGPKGDKGDPGDVPEWVLQTKITVSNTAPSSPSIGDLWIDTN